MDYNQLGMKRYRRRKIYFPFFFLLYNTHIYHSTWTRTLFCIPWICKLKERKKQRQATNRKIRNNISLTGKDRNYSNTMQKLTVKQKIRSNKKKKKRLKSPEIKKQKNKERKGKRSEKKQESKNLIFVLTAWWRFPPKHLNWFDSD